MTFNELTRWAQEKGICQEVDIFPLHSQKALVIKAATGFHIAINETCSEREKLECLLHELGHIMTDSVYAVSDPDQERIRKEKKADEWAVDFKEKYGLH